MADDGRRFIPPGSCMWCGHPLHDTDCRAKIRTGRDAADPCPCSRHTWKASR